MNANSTLEQIQAHQNSNREYVWNDSFVVDWLWMIIDSAVVSHRSAPSKHGKRQRWSYRRRGVGDSSDVPIVASFIGLSRSLFFCVLASYFQIPPLRFRSKKTTLRTRVAHEILTSEKTYVNQMKIVSLVCVYICVSVVCMCVFFHFNYQC